MLINQFAEKIPLMKIVLTQYIVVVYRPEEGPQKKVLYRIFKGSFRRFSSYRTLGVPIWDHLMDLNYIHFVLIIFL